jgi:glycosyltransferase involved in cell wall biosynthesis
METFYRECDVFCLPSIDDGFGMVVFEAMGCGVPVIVSENAGASEMLSNKHCSDVVEPRNVVQISEAIHKYYVQRELLENAKHEAVTFFREVTAVDYHFNSMKDLYKDVFDDHIKQSR